MYCSASATVLVYRSQSDLAEWGWQLHSRPIAQAGQTPPESEGGEILKPAVEVTSI